MYTFTQFHQGKNLLRLVSTQMVPIRSLNSSACLIQSYKDVSKYWETDLRERFRKNGESACQGSKIFNIPMSGSNNVCRKPSTESDRHSTEKESDKCFHGNHSPQVDNSLTHSELCTSVYNNSKASCLQLTHTDETGRAEMVDVGGKPITPREACARASIWLGPEAFALVKENKMKKGDVLTVAQISGILAAKKTAELIPLCHNIALTKVDVRCSLNEKTFSVDIETLARTSGVTGVEMEALMAASVAALTVYDMCKAVTREMVISDVKLVMKTGGVHGDYLAK